MATVRLSSKGQIVIPKAVRDQLHLQAGAEFFVSASALGVRLVPVQAFPVTTPAALRGALAKPGGKLPDEDAIKASIKSRLKARNSPLSRSTPISSHANCATTNPRRPGSPSIC